MIWELAGGPKESLVQAPKLLHCPLLLRDNLVESIRKHVWLSTHSTGPPNTGAHRIALFYVRLTRRSCPSVWFGRRELYTKPQGLIPATAKGKKKRFLHGQLRQVQGLHEVIIHVPGTFMAFAYVQTIPCMAIS